MKKVLSMLWVSCFCVALMGCGGGDEGAPASGGGEAPATESAPADEAPAAEEAPAEEAPAEEGGN